MTGFVIYGFINANRENQGIIKPEVIDLFIKLWADYDNEATGWSEVVDVVFLIYELPHLIINFKKRLIFSKNFYETF